MSKAIRVKKCTYNHYLVLNTDAIYELTPKAFYVLCLEQDRYYKGFLSYNRKSAFKYTQLGENVYNECIKELKQKGYLTITRIHNELWGSDYEYDFFAKDFEGTEEEYKETPRETNQTEKIIADCKRMWAHK